MPSERNNSQLNGSDLAEITSRDTLWIDAVTRELSDGVVVVDSLGVVVSCNDTLEGFVGNNAPSQDLLEWAKKHCFTSAGSTELGESLYETLGSLLTGTSLPPLDVFITRSGGTDGRFMRMHGHPVRGLDEEQVGAVLIFHDVDEELYIEQELRGANERLASSVDDLERSNHVMGLITEMGDFLLNCTSMIEFYSVTGSFVHPIFDGHTGSVYLLDESRSSLECVARFGDMTDAPAHFARDRCWGLRRGRAHRVMGRGTLSPRCDHVPTGTGDFVCLPMMAQGEALGVLHVNAGGSDKPIDEKTFQTMVSVGEHIAGALANLRLRQTLKVQAIRDPLTTLFNRRYMEEWLERELLRCMERGFRLSFLMIDLDHFKKYNDVHGHSAADMVLQRVAEVIKEVVGNDGIACRYGGEELVLVLPEHDEAAAVETGERVRRRLSELTLEYRGAKLGSVTASIGVAVSPGDGRDATTLMRKADDAMYSAKQGGRDQVACASTIEVEDAA